MFETLTERFSETLRKVAGKSTLTEDNIKETLREVRQVAARGGRRAAGGEGFRRPGAQRALGQEVLKSLSPGQAFLRIVQRELEQAMGAANEGLDLAVQPPAVILMAGLQGSRQDHQRGQARALVAREGQEGADGQCRRLSPGGDPAARDAGQPASMRRFHTRA
jgi:signal recognition particle GTPase